MNTATYVIDEVHLLTDATIKDISLVDNRELTAIRAASGETGVIVTCEHLTRGQAQEIAEELKGTTFPSDGSNVEAVIKDRLKRKIEGYVYEAEQPEKVRSTNVKVSDPISERLDRIEEAIYTAAGGRPTETTTARTRRVYINGKLYEKTDHPECEYGYNCPGLSIARRGSTDDS